MLNLDKNKERSKRILAIALDMHQAKEIRIQAVRLLRAMDAIDELWTVVHTVKCSITRQSAIDSIPALEFKHKTEIYEEILVPENAQRKETERTFTTNTNIRLDRLELP